MNALDPNGKHNMVFLLIKSPNENQEDGHKAVQPLRYIILKILNLIKVKKARNQRAKKKIKKPTQSKKPDHSQEPNHNQNSLQEIKKLLYHELTRIIVTSKLEIKCMIGKPCISRCKLFLTLLFRFMIG